MDMDSLADAASSLQLDAQPFDFERMTEDQVRLIEDAFDPFCGKLRAVFLDDIAEAVERLQRYTAKSLSDFLAAHPDIPTRAEA
jgi:hypothetical protein